MADTPTLQIPKDVIEPIIQAHIAAAVASALNGRERLMTDAIHRVLQSRVDANGQPERYNSSSSPTFVEWLMQDAIKKAAREALTEQVAKLQPAIKKAIADQLTNSKSPLVKQLVEGMSGAIVKMASDQWRLKIDYGRD